MDEWQLEDNEKEGVLFKQHTHFAERVSAAQACVQDLDLRIPALVDGMDDAAAEAFSAWPERIYIVNQAGRIHYLGGPGPQGFDPKEARSSLATLLADTG